MSAKITEFPNQTSYQIGNITYQVTSVFSDSQNTLKEKLYNLLKAEARENHTVAESD